MIVGVIFTDSAGKHSISEEDALHAIYHAVYTSTRVKASPEQPPRSRRVFVGPQHAQTSRLVEVLVEVRQGGEFVTYHVMPLGAHYKNQMDMEEES